MQPLITYYLLADYTKASFPVVCSVLGPPALPIRHAAALSSSDLKSPQTVLPRDQHPSATELAEGGGFQMLLGHFLLGAQSDNGVFILWRQDTFWVIPLT